jgi:ubiquinone/menaquinone biosynthesis C-methylase UbiE
MDAAAPRITNIRSLKKYAKKASIYDGTAHRTDWIRSATIDLLELQDGQCVLDVGCGSGLSFAQLLEGVGVTGTVIGFDQSSHMLEIAAKLIDRSAWKNVELQQGFGESIHFDCRFDAYLFHYTHDILQSPAAIKNLLRFAKPGARIEDKLTSPSFARLNLAWGISLEREFSLSVAKGVIPMFYH